MKQIKIISLPFIEVQSKHRSTGLTKRSGLFGKLSWWNLNIDLLLFYVRHNYVKRAYSKKRIHSSSCSTNMRSMKIVKNNLFHAKNLIHLNSFFIMRVSKDLIGFLVENLVMNLELGVFNSCVLNFCRYLRFLRYILGKRIS